MTRQYTIGNMPEWLSATPAQGTMEAKDEKSITFTVSKGLSPGKYNRVVYLTDDQGLSESLVIDIEVESVCPWDDIDTKKYERNMSLCAQVFIDNDGTEIIDTAPEDIVGIFIGGELVGKGSVNEGDNMTKGIVYITVYGESSFNGKTMTAWLWQHSTGKTILLTADRQMTFNENGCLGCPPSEPVWLAASDGMRQTITLDAGWTWTSFHIKPQSNGIINNVLYSDTEFDSNDEIKSPATSNFCRYNDSTMLWIGSLTQFNYKYIHMFHTAEPHTIYVHGTALSADEDHTVPLRHGWNVLPYLRSRNQNLREALSSYYPYATEGDIVKSHDEFAVFSANGRWEGNLTYMQPGKGYFLYRQASGEAAVIYQPANEAANAPQLHNSKSQIRKDSSAPIEQTDSPEFRNPDAATNMTIIAALAENGNLNTRNSRVFVYVGNELVGIAHPQEVDGDRFYFLTIQSDKAGILRFETEDGMVLRSLSFETLNYIPDNHHGSLRVPVLLTTREEDNDYVEKRIINGILYIFHGNRVYNAQGILVEKP